MWAACELRSRDVMCAARQRGNTGCAALTSGVGPPPAAADSAGSPVPRSLASSFGCVFSSR